MNFLNSHGLALMLGYYVFSAVVSGMPEPPSDATLAYIWAYHSAHALAGDLSHAFGSRIQKP